MVRRLVSAAALSLVLGGCTHRGAPLRSTEAPSPRHGVVRVLTYNVAGLPAPVAKTEPERTLPRIAPLMNRYDLALVQEDFWYHELLSRGVSHPHRSQPRRLAGGLRLGDGLRRFSMPAFEGFERHAWKVCHGTIGNGSDCLAAKGFTFAVHTLAPGVTVDVYNLHMEASHEAADRAARRAQVEQLLEALRTRSRDRPIIVAGDTNMRLDDEENFTALLQGAGLVDSCRSLGKGEPGRVDRVMVRSSDDVELKPADWRIDPSFVDDEGSPLSDHEAVAVDVAWRIL